MNKRLMQEGKIKSVINKLINIENKTDSWKNHIDKGLFVRGEIGEKPQINHNRLKFNRMDNNKDQEEYMVKCDNMIKAYKLYFKGGSFIYVGYLVYLYANNHIRKQVL